MPAEIDQFNLTGAAERNLGLGLNQRLARQNRGGKTITTNRPGGTNEIYQPGSSFYSNDPLQGTVLEDGAILGLDPLGIFDVPQIQTDIDRLDPEYLADIVSKQARRNAGESIDLEKEYDPTTFAAREGAMQNLLADIQSGNVGGADIEARLQELMNGSDMSTPELEQSQLLNAARERAMADLEMGYELPQEIRNLVARNSAQQASGGGFLGGQIGRDIGARDLGLTGLDLYNQRLSRASDLGTQQEQTNIGQQGLKANIANMNRMFGLQSTQALAQQRQQEFQNRFGTAQFTQGLERPEAGLDPGALASFYVGDLNQRNNIVNNANVAQLEAASNAKTSQNDLIGDVAGGLMGMFCWVAREVYEDDQWMVFRLWLLSRAPEWLFKLYCKHGEGFAKWIHDKPIIKFAIRKLMDRKVRVMYAY